MTDAAVPESTEAPKSSKMPLIIGLVLALLGGGGGFFAASTGLILAPDSKIAEEPEEKASKSSKKLAFVAMEPLTISMPPSSRYRHLLFRAEMEVNPDYKSEVTTLLPRVVDVLNGYLRALDISDIEAPSALTRLRAQMLRRVQIVAGPGRVNDLLIMEFVLN